MFGGFLNDAVTGSMIEINQICYRIIPGNNHSENTISLFNPENDTYLRHRFGVLLPSHEPETIGTSRTHNSLVVGPWRCCMGTVWRPVLCNSCGFADGKKGICGGDQS